METIVNKIKRSVQSGTGLTCLYGSLDSINVQMGDQTEFPVAFFVLLNNGSLDDRSSNYRERVDVAMFFVKPTEFDFESIENEAIISECKQCAFQWLNSLFLGGDLRYITTLNTSRVYNQMDDILTGYALRVRLEELVGECAPEPFKTTCEITATSNDPTLGGVTGGGVYEKGKTVTLNAIRDGSKSKFVSWTINGEVVSNEPTYTFTAEDDVTVVGNFALNYLTFTALEDNSSVSWYRAPYPNLEYSTDGSTWTPFTEPVQVNNGGNVLFRNNGTDWIASSYQSCFITTGVFNLSGNIMSLVDNTVESTEIPIEYCFVNLFGGINTYYEKRNGCNIVDAGELELPATTLTRSCYYFMFFYCKLLVNAPELPAMALSSHCYMGMFSNCTSLVNAPELPATELVEYCYRNMFSECTSLTTAPELPATAIAPECYNGMFFNCTSLVNVQDVLPSTTLPSWCYASMFAGCTSLVKAPDIMGKGFGGNRTEYMFSRCSSLNYIKTYQDSLHSDEWVKDVSPTGDFYCLSSIPDVYGVNGIPVGWTRHNID